MHQLTIKKRNERVGKNLNFKIYIDEIEVGMVNSSKSALFLTESGYTMNST